MNDSLCRPICLSVFDFEKELQLLATVIKVNSHCRLTREILKWTWLSSVILGIGRWKQENQKFKTIFCNRAEFEASLGCMRLSQLCPQKKARKERRNLEWHADSVFYSHVTEMTKLFAVLQLSIISRSIAHISFSGQLC